MSTICHNIFRTLSGMFCGSRLVKVPPVSSPYELVEAELPPTNLLKLNFPLYEPVEDEFHTFCTKSREFTSFWGKLFRNSAHVFYEPLPQPVKGRRFFFAGHFGHLFLWGYLGLKESQIPGEK